MTLHQDSWARQVVSRFLDAGEFPGTKEARLWVGDGGLVAGQFFGCQLSSVFQPLLDLGSGRTHGYEAFVRSAGVGRGGIDTLSPWTLFSRAADDDRLILLDRLCRTLHTLNFLQASSLNTSPRRLFLNVHGRLLLAVASDHGRTFRRVTDSLFIPSHRVVIETPEAVEGDVDLLATVLGNYRSNGFAVAVNLSRATQLDALLARFVPDYIKLDARTLSDAAQIRDVIDHGGRYGVPVIFKRIEDSRRLAELHEAGSIFGQGHLLGSPSPLHERNYADIISAGWTNGARAA